MHEERNPFFRDGLIAGLSTAKFRRAVCQMDQAGTAKSGDDIFVSRAFCLQHSIFHAHSLHAMVGHKLSKLRFSGNKFQKQGGIKISEERRRNPAQGEFPHFPFYYIKPLLTLSKNDRLQPPGTLHKSAILQVARF